MQGTRACQVLALAACLLPVTAGQLVIRDVRLVDLQGTVQPGLDRGWVQVLVDGAWSSVCDDLWDNKAATVTCKQLGFASGGVAVRNAYTGTGVGEAKVHEVHCTGSEASLAQCKSSSSIFTGCHVTEVAGVNCTVDITPPSTLGPIPSTTRTSTGERKTTPVPAATTAAASGSVTDVFNSTSFSSTSSSIKVAWTVHSNLSSVVIFVQVEYRITAIGDCDNTTLEAAVQRVSAQEGGVTLPVLPWRTYHVKVMAYSPSTDLVVTDIVERSITTETAIPTGVVTHVALTQVTSSGATITWDDVACSERNGALVRYEVLVNDSSQRRPSGLKVPSASVRLEHLQPETSIGVQIRYVNNVGHGPFSDVFRFTTPKGSVSITSRNISQQGVDLAVSGQKNATKYQISYSTSRDFKAALTKQWTFQSGAKQISLTDLMPHTTYYIKIRAATTNQGWGLWSDVIRVVTKPAQPSAPASLSGSYRNESCIAVSWTPPRFPNGVIEQYKVTLQRIDSGSSSQRAERLVRASVRTFTLCGLVPGATVTFTVSAKTAAGFGQSVSATLTTKGTAGSDVTSGSNSVAIGVVVTVVIVIAVALIAAAVFWHRRRGRIPAQRLQLPEVSNPGFTISSYPECHSEKFWSRTTTLQQDRCIVPDRGNHLERSKGSNDLTAGIAFITFHKEFASLPREFQASVSVAKSARNKSRNRFPDLLPYDNTRVVLHPDPDTDNTYINASHIRGFQKTAGYIAAQSPFDPDTALDYWRLIYQYGITTVVALVPKTKKRNRKSVKFPFMPEPRDRRMAFGSISLELIAWELCASYVVKTVTLQSLGTGSSKTVTMFEFTDWPDRDVPDDPIPLLDMRRKVTQHHASEATPILVHCGTGVDRTGTYIAIDALIHKYSEDQRVCVYRFVLGMRSERPGMVRTFRQYVFIYDSILEELHAGNTSVDGNLMEQFDHLTQRNPETGRSFLREQFRLLDKFQPAEGPTLSTVALLPVNRHKNRYNDVIPRDDHRPILVSLGNGRPGSDYINAVFMDSHKRKRQFVVTQTPLAGTVGDFWRLVHESRASTVVMMESLDLQDDESPQYWPKTSPNVYGALEVETKASTQQGDVTIRDFRLCNSRNPDEPALHLRHFLYDGWRDSDITPVSRTSMLNLLEIVQEWHRNAGKGRKPIIVHCMDGATKSGLFVALWNVCEKMQDEGKVDVYHTVRQLKKRRRQIVCEMDHYKFCYKTLWGLIQLQMDHGDLADTLGQTTSEDFFRTELQKRRSTRHVS